MASEFILAWIGWTIEHTYMVAVIAFVALQFGWIKRGETPLPTSSSGTPSESGKGVNQKMDFGNILQGVLGQMAPMLNQMTAPGVPPTEESDVPQLEGSPTLKPRTFE